MTDLPPYSAPIADDALPAKLVYWLFLAGFIAGFTPFIGLVVAYVNIGAAPPWLQTHYRFQIRTFWLAFLGLLLFVPVGLILSLVLAIPLVMLGLGFVLGGWLLLLPVLLWVVIRSVRGLGYLARRESHPIPASWGFG